jgi:aryl-alcohol dehydrogenase-like predicted oxidoreductase
LRAKKKEKIPAYTTGGVKMTSRMPKGNTSAKCLHYTLSQPGVCVAVPGASNLEELRDCLNYLKVPNEEKTYETEVEELFLNEIKD